MPKDYKFPPLPKLIKEKNSPRGMVPGIDEAHTDEPYNAFLDQIDPRNKPETQLALAASNDKRFREFLRVVNHPKYKRNCLAYVAKVCDIGLPEFAEFWRRANQTRAFAVAAEGLPALTQDMLGDAASKKEVCERCDGFGYVEVPEARMVLEDGKPIDGSFRPMGVKWVRDCPVCEGNGRLSRPGDSHARDKLILMNGIGQKGSGVTVAINNYGGMGIEAAGNRMSNVTFEVSAEEITGEVESD